MLIEIDAGRCIGCGKCVADCVGSNLLVEDGTARVKGRCILCGHCVAVCPTAAVSIPGYDMADVEPSAPAGETIDAADLLRAIKSRRSVRSFKPEPVGRQELEFVLQAGRYTATAKNAQGCRFVVVQDDLAELKRLVWDGIEELACAAGRREAALGEALQAVFARHVRGQAGLSVPQRAGLSCTWLPERADDAGPSGSEHGAHGSRAGPRRPVQRLPLPRLRGAPRRARVSRAGRAPPCRCACCSVVPTCPIPARPRACRATS